MPWTCSEDCKRGGAVGITLDFNEVAVIRLTFAASIRHPEATRSRYESTHIISQEREPRSAPRCYYCKSPALWQDGSDSPIRRVAGLTAELIYQDTLENPEVQFSGAYAPDELVAEILKAGWARPSWYSPDQRFDDDFELAGVPTDAFVHPALVRRWADDIRKICVSWGIPLAGPRRRTLEESM